MSRHRKLFLLILVTVFMLALLPQATFAATATGTFETGVQVTVTTPDDRASCIDSVTYDQVVIDFANPNGLVHLAGTITVEMVTASGHIVVATYPVDTTDDLVVTVAYPRVSDWPVFWDPSANTWIREIHVDIGLEFYQDTIYGRVFGEFPVTGLDWDLFCHAADPGTGCTLTPGYWKTHSALGPAPYDPNWLKIGPAQQNTAFFLSGQSHYTVLWTPPAGNGYYILAHAYIATKLNMLSGASVPGGVLTAFNTATGLFNSYTPAQIGALKGGNALRQQFIALGTILDNYNNGYLGVPHCFS